MARSLRLERFVGPAQLAAFLGALRRACRDGPARLGFLDSAPREGTASEGATTAFGDVLPDRPARPAPRSAWRRRQGPPSHQARSSSSQQLTFPRLREGPHRASVQGPTERRLCGHLGRSAGPKVRAIDELGDLTIGEPVAHLLLQLVASRDEKRATSPSLSGLSPLRAQVQQSGSAPPKRSTTCGGARPYLVMHGDHDHLAEKQRPRPSAPTPTPTPTPSGRQVRRVGDRNESGRFQWRSARRTAWRRGRRQNAVRRLSKGPAARVTRSAWSGRGTQHRPTGLPSQTHTPQTWSPPYTGRTCSVFAPRGPAPRLWHSRPTPRSARLRETRGLTPASSPEASTSGRLRPKADRARRSRTFPPRPCFT